MGRYSKELLEESVKHCKSYSDVCRWFNIGVNGAAISLMKKRLIKYSIDTGHFLGKASHAGKYQTGKYKKKLPEEILVSNKNRREKAVRLRVALVEAGVEYKCQICENPGLWREKPLMLEVDHISGDWKDCRKENLRFLCPQCHSQVTYPTFTEKDIFEQSRKKTNVCVGCGIFVSKRVKRCEGCHTKSLKKMEYCSNG